MKSVFVLVFLTVIGLSNVLQAQTTVAVLDDRSNMYFGIKAGINNANVWDEQNQNFNADRKLGLVFGAFASLPFGTLLGFQPELLIAQKGFRGNGVLFGSEYSFSRTTTHVDIPLQLQVKPTAQFTILIGPQISYLIHQRDVFTFGANSTAQEQEFDNENLRRSTLGFTLGADVNFTRLVISGRLGYDFQDNHGDGSSSTPRYKNHWLQLTLGYKL